MKITHHAPDMVKIRHLSEASFTSDAPDKQRIEVMVMRIIAGGRGAVNPYAAIARPYLEKFHKQVDEMRGGSKMALAFNKLNLAERKAVFVLGNALAFRSPHQMDKLSEQHIVLNYGQLSEKEQLTVLRGMKEIKKLANKIPYSPPGEEEALKNPRKVTAASLEYYQADDFEIADDDVINAAVL
ncbi:hypothetical protein [Erwinia pyrifoliae]|uniref:hypothetical protein n=1 Tax=Erwinia pyrifoliae TaxID=79967 RepID=UPI0021FCEC11|nr:hypothetical protein [Erwinia pyrifoliae]UWS30651.1 hypothetical protein NYP81_04060 [Erwinia pyrifoliae]